MYFRDIPCRTATAFALSGGGRLLLLLSVSLMAWVLLENPTAVVMLDADLLSSIQWILIMHYSVMLHNPKYYAYYYA